MAHLLEVKDLVTRFYSEGTTIHAVNGISYTLDEGESLAIVGESGSGKSVGVMSVMGLIRYPPGRVEGGEVLFKNRDLLKLSADEMRKVRGDEIAMVFQDPMTSLNPVLPVGLQLMEPLVAHKGLDKAAARARAAELLALVGLPNAADRLKDFPFQFSGGQRQRIMIAMALACNPSLLIADEPTTALDVTIQAQILDLLRKMKDEFGMSIMLITHDLGVIAEMADDVVVMYAGRVVERAPVRELFSNPSHPYTKGLLQSKPSLHDVRDRLYSIPGQVPNLLGLPEECHFADRCKHCTDKCRRGFPPVCTVSENHTVACTLYEEVQP